MIAAGGSHFLLLTTTGEVYVTGYNRYGQLGLGDIEQVNSWTHLPFPAPVTAIATGYYSYALMTTGEVYATGDNEKGMLGWVTMKTVTVGHQYPISPPF